MHLQRNNTNDTKINTNMDELDKLVKAWDEYFELDKITPDEFDEELDEEFDPLQLPLEDCDIGKVVIYYDGHTKQYGVIKGYNNDNQIAWIVTKCNGEWHNFIDYTGQSTDYEYLYETGVDRNWLIENKII